MTKNYDIFNNEIVIDILDKFKRKCPKKVNYVDRLATEFEIIIKKNFIIIFFKFMNY